MKKCDHFKDLILTDYIDTELDKDSFASLESHLLDCNDCRAFLKEVKDNARLPFQQALRQPAPAGLWDMIKQSIEHENQARGLFADFIDTLKGLVVNPRAVLVFTSLILMLLAGSVALNTIQTWQAKETDQGEYLVALLSSRDSSVPSDNNDLGTPIEHYFLQEGSMTKFKKILFGFFGLYILAALPLAHAENPGGQGPSVKWHSGQRIQEIYNQLNLTDDQKKRLEANKQQHRAKIQSARQEIRINKEALQQELMKLKLDLPKINAIHQQIKSLQSKMEDDRLSSIIAVRAILTPEQFSKFVNLMHQHKQEYDK